MGDLREGVSVPWVYTILIRRWPALVTFAVLGALVFWLYGAAASRQYQAYASATVHHNVMRARPEANEREHASYINQETAQLENLAYSDVVWLQVGRQMAVEGWIPRPEDGMRLADSVRLPHPMDGEWRFAATARDPAMAARLANLWAEAFVARVAEGVAIGQRQDVLRQEIAAHSEAMASQALACAQLGAAADQVDSIFGRLTSRDPADPADPVEQAAIRQAAGYLGPDCAAGEWISQPADVAGQTDQATALAEALAAASSVCRAGLDALQADLAALQGEAVGLASDGLGLSPWLEVELTRRAVPPTSPAVASGWHILVGALLGIVVWTVVVAWDERRRGGTKAG